MISSDTDFTTCHPKSLEPKQSTGVPYKKKTNAVVGAVPSVCNGFIKQIKHISDFLSQFPDLNNRFEVLPVVKMSMPAFWARLRRNLRRSTERTVPVVLDALAVHLERTGPYLLSSNPAPWFVTVCPRKQKPF